MTLCDSADKIGGLLHFARGVKGDHERFDDYLTYIGHQLEKDGVEVKLNTTVDAAAVKEMAPDAVIVAVGGTRESKLSGTGVFTPEQAFGSTQLGEHVVMLGASVQAIDLSAWLVAHGKKVTIVHSGTAADVDKGQSGWFRTYMLPHLRSKGTNIINGATVKGLDNGVLTITTDMGFERTISCDSVVECYDMVPNTDLAEELEAAGYEAFGFDLSELLEGPGRYDMTVYIKEYESGVEIRSREFPCGPNKLLVSDFPEKVRGEILPGEMADPQAGIYMLAKKLTIGFYPSGTDSTAMLNFSIPEMREASQRLKLRSVTSSSGYTLTKYCTRPFGIDSFEAGKFIPLVFYGSMWFDAEHNLFRFCGENEIAPDLSGEIVGNIPHFYVIGIEFTPKQEPTNLKNN